ncbi:hypothetical protein [Reyranella sp.]|uniref:hypothetical protein n=1 Tax=Reyranella sp. TaxID=1929291 RepID=UPI003D13BFDB
MPVHVEGPSLPQLDRSIGEWVQANMQDLWPRALTAEVRRGFDPQPVVITDGVVGRDPKQVRPFGKIEFVARADIADLVMLAHAELVRRSPIGPEEGGHYRDDHRLLINDVEVKGPWRPALQRVRGGDRIQLVNVRIYARKLESATANQRTGRQRRRGSSRQAPGGIYRPVLRMIVQRYSRSVYVDYKLVKLNLGAKVLGQVGGRRKIKGRIVDGPKRPKVLRDQVYPALQLFVRPSQVS